MKLRTVLCLIVGLFMLAVPTASASPPPPTVGSYVDYHFQVCDVDDYCDIGSGWIYDVSETVHVSSAGGINTVQTSAPVTTGGSTLGWSITDHGPSDWVGCNPSTVNSTQGSQAHIACGSNFTDCGPFANCHFDWLRINVYASDFHASLTTDCSQPGNGSCVVDKEWITYP